MNGATRNDKIPSLGALLRVVRRSAPLLVRSAQMLQSFKASMFCWFSMALPSLV